MPKPRKAVEVRQHFMSNRLNYYYYVRDHTGWDDELYKAMKALYLRPDLYLYTYSGNQKAEESALERLRLVKDKMIDYARGVYTLDRLIDLLDVFGVPQLLACEIINDAHIAYDLCKKRRENERQVREHKKTNS